MSALLELKDLTIRFGGITAVDNVSLSIQTGEVAGLIGPNGAGKTTIFNLITGVYDATSGDVIYEGRNINKLKTYEIVPLGIARTFQNLRLFVGSTVLENVMTAAQRFHGYGFAEAISHLGRWQKKEREIKQESMELLERVGLADRAMQSAGTLPYGLQRRLEIARALSLRPKLLLLDEPAAGMNPEEVIELNKLITGIHKDFGLTILLIEHHMDMVMNICSHVVCINFGKKIADGTTEDIQNNADVLAAYLGEEEE